MSAITCVRGSAKNFRSIGDTITIMYNQLGNLNLVYSDLNGAGKSTLFVQLMVYALKGKAYNDKSKISNLVNLQNNKKMVVEFEFIKGDSTYIVRRGMKPKIFEIFKNGKLVETDISYQKQLDEIVGKDISFDMLINTIILSSSRYTPFRLQTKKQREEFLDLVFRTHVYNPMVYTNKKETADTQNKIDMINSSISHVSDLINATKKTIADFNNTKNDLSLDLNKQLNSYSVELDNLNDKKVKLKDTISEFVNENSNVINTKNELSLKCQELNNTIQVMMNQNKHEFEIYKQDSCPSCNQSISDDKKSEIKDIISGNVEIVKSHNEELKQLKQLLSEAEDNYNAYNEQLKLYQSETTSLINDINICKNNISSINTQLSANSQRMNTSIDKYKTELSKYEDALKTHKIEKDEQVSILCTQENAMRFLQDVNIRKEIMNNYVPYINAMLNEYLKEMEFFIEVSLDENYDIIVSSTSKSGLRIHDLSDGERSKIDLAFILVWKNIQDKITQDLIDIFILDETLANFSPQSVVDFLKLVKKVLPNHKIIVILQHPNDFMDVFDNVIELTVENDYTKLTDNSISELTSEDYNIFN